MIFIPSFLRLGTWNIWEEDADFGDQREKRIFNLIFAYRFGYHMAIRYTYWQLVYHVLGF